MSKKKTLTNEELDELFRNKACGNYDSSQPDSGLYGYHSVLKEWTLPNREVLKRIYEVNSVLAEDIRNISWAWPVCFADFRVEQGINPANATDRKFLTSKDGYIFVGRVKKVVHVDMCVPDGKFTFCTNEATDATIVLIKGQCEFQIGQLWEDPMVKFLEYEGKVSSLNLGHQYYLWPDSAVDFVHDVQEDLRLILHAYRPLTGR